VFALNKHTRSCIRQVQCNEQKIKSQQAAVRRRYEQTVQEYNRIEQKIRASGYDQGDVLLGKYDELLSFFRINNLTSHNDFSILFLKMKRYLSILQDNTYSYQRLKRTLHKHISAYDLVGFFSFSLKKTGQYDRDVKASMTEINVLQTELDNAVSLVSQCIGVLRELQVKIDVMPTEAIIFLQGKYHLNKNSYDTQRNMNTESLIKWSKCDTSIIKRFLKKMKFQAINEFASYVQSVKDCCLYLASAQEGYQEKMSKCLPLEEIGPVCRYSFFESIALLNEARDCIGNIENNVNRMQYYNNRIHQLLSSGLTCINPGPSVDLR